MTRNASVKEGERTLIAAMALRAALRGMAERLAAGAARVPQRTLDAINNVLRIPSGSRAVVQTADGYGMVYRDRFTESMHLLISPLSPPNRSRAGSILRFM